MHGDRLYIYKCFNLKGLEEHRSTCLFIYCGLGRRLSIIQLSCFKVNPGISFNVLKHQDRVNVTQFKLGWHAKFMALDVLVLRDRPSTNV